MQHYSFSRVFLAFVPSNLACLCFERLTVYAFLISNSLIYMIISVKCKAHLLELQSRTKYLYINYSPQQISCLNREIVAVTDSCLPPHCVYLLLTIFSPAVMCVRLLSFIYIL